MFKWIGPDKGGVGRSWGDLPADSICANFSAQEVTKMSTVISKEEAHRLIDRMPKSATWDDLMREIYVREVIESGLSDSNSGRTREVNEIRAKYGLSE